MNKTNMIHYSIIIPHKNIPKLLQRCLDSIPQRDDLEVIVVDDDSDPTIVDFDHFPGKERKDTTVIFDKSGKGAGRARNIGLKHAKGVKILFADADDFFNYCVRDILDVYKNDDSDIVFFRVSGINCFTYLNSNRGSYINRFHSLYENHNEEGLLHFRYDCGFPWAKIISKSLIDTYSIRFEETKIHNDTTFSYLTGFYGKKFKVDKRGLYCITYRDNSITYTLDEDKILTRMQVLSKRDRFFLDHDIDLNKIEVNLHIDSLVTLRKHKQKNLYNRCVQILTDNGLSKKEINKRMIKSLKKKMFKRLRWQLQIIIDKYL